MQRYQINLDDIIHCGYVDHPTEGRCIYGIVSIIDTETDNTEEFGFSIDNAECESNLQPTFRWEDQLSLMEPACGDRDIHSYILDKQEIITIEHILIANVKYTYLETKCGVIKNNIDVSAHNIEFNGKNVDSKVATVFFIGGALFGIVVGLIW